MTSELLVPGEPSLRLLIDPLLPAVIVPLQLALCNVVTVVAGISIFSENLTFYRGFGIILIVIGTGFLQIKKS